MTIDELNRPHYLGQFIDNFGIEVTLSHFLASNADIQILMFSKLLQEFIFLFKQKSFVHPKTIHVKGLPFEIGPLDDETPF